MGRGHPHGHGETRGRGWSSLAWERGDRGDRGKAGTSRVAQRVWMGLSSRGCRSRGHRGRPAGEGQRADSLLTELWDSTVQMSSAAQV